MEKKKRADRQTWGEGDRDGDNFSSLGRESGLGHFQVRHIYLIELSLLGTSLVSLERWDTSEPSALFLGTWNLRLVSLVRKMHRG